MIGQDKLRENLGVFVAAARERERAARPPPVLRPARPRQDVARADRRERDGRAVPRDERARARAERATSPACSRTSSPATCSSSTRSTACRRSSRRCSTRRWRTSASTCSIGQGPTRAVDPHRPPALHAGRRDDARRPPHRAAPRPLRLGRAPRLLRRRRISRACSGAPRASSRSSSRPRRPPRSRAARAARRASRTACCAACATSPRSERPRLGISDELAAYALERLDVDAAGFDALDRALLLALLEKFDGGPVGIDTLAAAIGEDRGTLEDVVEPFLIQEGFLERTPRGRIATRRAREHLGVRMGGPGQGKLL